MMVRNILFVAVALVIGSHAVVAQQLEDHLQGGEFGLAGQLAKQAALPERDPILAQIAGAQSRTGQPIAAARTTQQITNPGQRDQAIQGAGGGGFADFDSLMQLIQTVVVPDTWETLGGPSTMAPYPGGVYVDTKGTLRSIEAPLNANVADDLRALLGRQHDAANLQDDQAWRRPSKMRFVSLKRLLAQMTANRIQRPHVHPCTMDATTQNLAGLSRIQYVFLDGDDVVLAGPVGGIEIKDGWNRDRETGLCTLRTDFLLTCLQSTVEGQPFGCTIDPTPDGMRKAAEVTAAVSADKIPIGKAASHLQSALGMQTVEVFGTAGDTPIGYLMVEADRHMKELALGEVEMPEGVDNYLDVISKTIAQGPPNELLLRLWFTAKQRHVRANAARNVFELGGGVIQLSGENQRALANGGRGHAPQDPRTQMFVDNFNANWSAIRSKYPIYSALESVYQAASVAQLIQRYGEEQDDLVASLAADASAYWHLPTPRQVDSIATLHSVRHGRKIHHVVVASGGVSVKPRETLTGKLVDYPALASIASPKNEKPRVIQRWWWDAAK